MGLLTLIQIPCHHVLVNEIALNLKYRIGLKHFFNINLGIGIIKKLLFFIVFSTYLPVFLLKFRSGELVGCGIKFCIQRVPAQHTCDGPRYPKNKKYLKKRNDDVIITFFQVFLVFGVAGPSKVCRVGTCWMWNLILHPTRSLDQNLSKNMGRHVENTNKKSNSFYDTYPQIYIKKVFKTYTVFQI